MKINTLFNKNKPVFSLEVFPPKKITGIDGVKKTLNTLDNLADIKPDFISVTYGAGGSVQSGQACEIASYIKNNLKIEPLSHLTCVNFTKEQTEINLNRLKDSNIENILALRGDVVDEMPLHPDFTHASDLAKLIREELPNVNVVGACYPEGHFENKNLDEDISNLRYKLDNGVTHLITQLFFDNDKFYNFMNKLRDKNIDVPVEAGIMPIVNIKQIEKTVALSGASLPVEFTHMVSRYSHNKEALYHAGIAYAIEQIYELLENGVEGIHVYTMNNADVAKAVYSGIKDKLGR